MHFPFSQAQEPWLQSRVFGLHSRVHKMSVQSGFCSRGTHETGWQHCAGTQSASVPQTASEGWGNKTTTTMAITNIRAISKVLICLDFFNFALFIFLMK